MAKELRRTHARQLSEDHASRARRPRRPGRARRGCIRELRVRAGSPARGRAGGCLRRDGSSSSAPMATAGAGEAATAVLIAAADATASAAKPLSPTAAEQWRHRRRRHRRRCRQPSRPSACWLNREAAQRAHRACAASGVPHCPPHAGATRGGTDMGVGWCTAEAAAMRPVAGWTGQSSSGK